METRSESITGMQDIRMTFQTHWRGVPLELAPPQGGSSYHIYTNLRKMARERSFVTL